MQGYLAYSVNLREYMMSRETWASVLEEVDGESSYPS